MTTIQLYFKLIFLPKALQKEVVQFVEGLLSKANKQHFNSNRKAGLAKGKIRMKANFDEPLEDFKEYT